MRGCSRLSALGWRRRRRLAEVLIGGKAAGYDECRSSCFLVAKHTAEHTNVIEIEIPNRVDSRTTGGGIRGPPLRQSAFAAHCLRLHFYRFVVGLTIEGTRARVFLVENKTRYSKNALSAWTPDRNENSLNSEIGMNKSDSGGGGGELL